MANCIVILLFSAVLHFHHGYGHIVDPAASQQDNVTDEVETSPNSASSDLRGFIETADVVWISGNLIIRTLSLNDGTDSMAYLLRSKAENGTELIELNVTAALLGRIIPGTEVTARGSVDFDEDNQKILLVLEIFPSSLAYKSITYQLSFNNIQEPSSEALPSFASASATAAVGTDVIKSGGSDAIVADLHAKVTDGYGVANGASSLDSPIASITSTLTSSLWTQIRTVTSMSVLVMVAQVCTYPAAVASTSYIEQMMFDGPGSYASTLEGYYSECSQGKAYLNRNNSKVVGNVVIPCSYNGTTITFNTDSCSYSNNDAWHDYAQYYVQTVLGIDITPYQHRVLLLPRLFTTWTGCGWVGQGTLGPDQVSATGAYLSSKVWLSGEYWNTPMSYFHELGHTNYLHHSIQAGCQYCDLSCPMGGCCSIRCFNAPHNWQLGWGGPLATLSSQNFTTGSWITFNLPAQNTAHNNMIMVQPDWNPSYNYGTTYSWYISYRVNSGKYDQQIPGDYTFVTNIYWWDGQYQLMPIMTNWMAGVYNGQIFTNMTDMFSVRQVSGGSLGAVVQLCRMSQVQERSCNDGLDNDCNGLIDSEDPACIAAAAGKPTPPVLVQVTGSSAKPPPPNPIRPPQPPSLPVLPQEYDPAIIIAPSPPLPAPPVLSPKRLPPPTPTPPSPTPPPSPPHHPPTHPKPSPHPPTSPPHPPPEPPTPSPHNSFPSPPIHVVKKSPSLKKSPPSHHHKPLTLKKKSPPPHKKPPLHHPPPHNTHPPPLHSAARKALEASMQSGDNAVLQSGHLLAQRAMMSTDVTAMTTAAGIGEVAQESWDFVSMDSGLGVEASHTVDPNPNQWSSEGAQDEDTEGAVLNKSQGSESLQEGDEATEGGVTMNQDVRGMMEEVTGHEESEVEMLVSFLSKEGGGAETLLQRLRQRQREGRQAATFSERPLVKWWQIEARDKEKHWVAEHYTSNFEQELEDL
ncbi:hypothetical protein CEUSTIGMA_g2318.t1 [Chlamydomonas eustigma]|uniref:Peptidase M11 gametolysin domain-containing protein n=1 Tax=Chlamydomonas eustigma TaxID=1157962 RepID=A0A250WW72_9CHLO|nr:hypothetical protein CEUSTIGMA_g2318.t1 [Chlamydomonas eustigma]|eukprot:GAX74872.1 hypothetical protein CEUSTIGMA_g2318.t1 [Chlamydomonas eustigma]